MNASYLIVGIEKVQNQTTKIFLLPLSLAFETGPKINTAKSVARLNVPRYIFRRLLLNYSPRSSYYRMGTFSRQMCCMVVKDYAKVEYAYDFQFGQL